MASWFCRGRVWMTKEKLMHGEPCLASCGENTAMSAHHLLRHWCVQIRQLRHVLIQVKFSERFPSSLALHFTCLI